MSTEIAQFEVETTFALPRRQAIVVGGKILSGSVIAGMNAKVLMDSKPCMAASVSAIGFLLCKGGREITSLVLDVPETNTQELWVEMCKPGDVISVVPAGKDNNTAS